MVVTGISHKAPYSEWRDDRCKKQRLGRLTLTGEPCNRIVPMSQGEKDAPNSTIRKVGWIATMEYDVETQLKRLILRCDRIS